MLTLEQLELIRKRADRYSKLTNLEKLDAGEAEENYAEDIPQLLREIEQLKEQLKDRETDLEFEYQARIEAEQKLDDLKDRLNTCESELRFEQFLRHAEAR